MRRSQECCRAESVIPPPSGDKATQELHETMRLGWLARAAFVCADFLPLISLMHADKA
jgi:hypothetical protein